MINIHVARKDFGASQILNDIRLEMSAGEKLAVLGPSGIGKSTLLRIVAGLDRDFQGAVRVPEKLAFVFQEPTLLPWRNVADNLRLTTGIETPETALSDVGLAGFGEHFPNQLSLGQQRRVALARALAAAPDLLILDEPFASLDRDTLEDMLTLTERLVKNMQCAVLIVTHSEEEAKRLATKAVVLEGKPAKVADYKTL